MTTSPSFTWTSDDEPVRSFPSGATYVEALQNTGLCFRGTDLAGAEVRTDALGRPRAISGNFAGVFSLTVDGARYAIKCFTREAPEQATRYRAVGEHLARLDDDWTVGFDYLGRGIMVEGSWYPVLRMEWVEAVSLIRWIDRNVDDPAALADVAARFARLVADLAASGVGHGDLQHGNLLITDDGAVKLVDYDGMYVPALAGLPAAETGHRNYQSPDRTAAEFGPEVDRFSSWVVYLSLVALAVDPSLWRQLRDEDAEHLLLAESDFTDPASSFRLATLTGHADARLRALAVRFQDILLHHRAAAPPLEPLDLVDAVAPALPVLPSWMAERVEPHVPAPPPSTRFSGGSRASTASAWALSALLPLGVPAAIFVDESLLAVDVLAWTAFTVSGYRRQPERLRARAARAERKRLLRARKAAEDEVARLEQETGRIVRAAEESKAEQDFRRRAFQQRYNLLIGSHQRAVKERLDRIDRERQALAARLHLEDQRLLVLRQKDHVRACLAKFPLRSADIEGVWPALVDRLEDADIRTAADFVGIRYDTHGPERVAIFVLVDGRGVRVAGIDEVKAGLIDQWRERLTAEATQTRPSSSTPEQQQVLRDRFAAEKTVLDARYQRVLAEAEMTTRGLRASLRVEQAALAEEMKAANSATARARADHDRAVAEAAVTLERTRKATSAAIAEAATFQPITYRRYLRFLLTGRR
ncbi:hypothetical protein ACRAKI_23570 [Saccharothrix isguenensis]